MPFFQLMARSATVRMWPLSKTKKVESDDDDDEDQEISEDPPLEPPLRQRMMMSKEKLNNFLSPFDPLSLRDDF
jgi:hypothetical protein